MNRPYEDVVADSCRLRRSARNIGKTVRVILSGVHGTGTKPNREAATSEAESGSRTNHI